LGDAHIKAGSKELAIENYEKSSKLDLGISNAVEKLRVPTKAKYYPYI